MGYTSLNFTSKIDITEFDSPGDPAFESFDDTEKRNGHRYFTIPIGLRLKIHENLFIPLELSWNIELENQSQLFKTQFMSFNTGIGYIQNVSEKLAISIIPTVGIPIFPTEQPNQFDTKMILTYGLRLNLKHKL